MNFTKRQLVLLTTSLTLFYDEIAKTATPEFKAEVMEIAEMVQEAYEEAE
jgi:transcription antitermination factor NusA-like protein